MNRNLTAVAGLVFGLMTASTLEAQMARPVTFGIGAGITLQSDLGDDPSAIEFESGYHFQGMVGFRAPMFPVGLRADVMYHTSEVSDFDDVSLKTLAGTVNAMFEMGGLVASPYLTAGIGGYNLQMDVEGVDNDADLDDTVFGLNGGAGIRFNLSGFNTFLEARYHHIMTDDATSMIPITFGIMF